MSRQVPHLRSWKGNPERIVIDGVEVPVMEWTISGGSDPGLLDVTIRLKAELADGDPQPEDAPPPPDAPPITVAIYGNFTGQQFADAVGRSMLRASKRKRQAHQGN